MSPSPLLLVLGSGPGIGITTAKLFAQRHFSKIALLSRNAQRLESEKKDIINAAGAKDVEVTVFPTDLGNLDQLRETLAKVEEIGPIGCVFFNAARIQPSEVLTAPVEELEEDFKVTTLALYVTAQWAIPLLAKSNDAKASFVVTSSLLPEHPIPQLLSLSAVKASQQNVVQSLRMVYGKDIHIGLVKVGGLVSPEEKNLNPTKIAEEIVGYYEQDKQLWGDDIVLHQ